MLYADATLMILITKGHFSNMFFCASAIKSKILLKLLSQIETINLYQWLTNLSQAIRSIKKDKNNINHYYSYYSFLIWCGVLELVVLFLSSLSEIYRLNSLLGTSVFFLKLLLLLATGLNALFERGLVIFKLNLLTTYYFFLVYCLSLLDSASKNSLLRR